MFNRMSKKKAKKLDKIYRDGKKTNKKTITEVREKKAK